MKNSTRHKASKRKASGPSPDSQWLNGVAAMNHSHHHRVPAKHEVTEEDLRRARKLIDRLLAHFEDEPL